MKKATLFLILFISLWFSGCDDNPLEVDLSSVDRKIEIKHFDLGFYNSDSLNFNQTQLSELRDEYPLFFMMGDLEFWRNQRQSSSQYLLYKDIKLVFGDYSSFDREFSSFASHLYYYYPNHPLNSIQTYISNLDFEYPVVFADSVLFISSDLFLGGNHPAYQMLPDYLRFQRQSRFLQSVLSESVMAPLVNKDLRDQSLVNEMIYWGRVYYAIKALNPHLTDDRIMRFSKDELAFCLESEESMWRYFVKQEYLFSPDQDLKRRFIEVAPFSKFGVTTDLQTPGSVGKWVGLRIIESFMKNNPETSLQQLLSMSDAQEIFKKSKYKP